MLVIGVDTGGTFTDLIYHDGHTWQVHKLLSTARNPAQAVLTGLKTIAGDLPRQIVHGSTVATNAILERKGSKTALITNTGFTDMLMIGRQNRSQLYDLFYRRAPQIVPLHWCFGVGGRILHTGEEHQKFDDEAARTVCEQIKAAGIESVAVSFLFAFANSSHERKMAAMVAALGIPVCLSHEILSEFREFERTSTTMINAYIGPQMKQYLSYMQENLPGHDNLRIMQSNGGSISAETAMQESVRTILSGPAGGVVGAFEIGRRIENTRLITFDMGGTSTDVSLIDGSLSLRLESEISGYPIKIPMIDIHTVGAGGGSIARVDAGGSLLVGPQSAGADPGPVCYGRGDRITVADANLFLGRLIPEHFLGGTMKLYAERLDEHFLGMARQISMDPTALAEGILAVANASMERAVRVISVERGYDPREFTLFAFGGAGGLHAADLAAHLNIPRVLIPPNPGILSALGMLMADIVKDYSQTVMLSADDIGAGDLQEYFAPLHDRSARELAREGIENRHMIMDRFLDMRYEGQSYEIITPFTPEYIQTFHALHKKTYGYCKDHPVQIVNIRLQARGAPPKPMIEKMTYAGEKPSASAGLGRRMVIFDGRARNTSIFKRELLGYGNRIRGPAVIVEYSSTTIVPPDTQARVDEYGNIIIDISTIE